ncbi:MAG: hypothetical protein U0N61_09155 [Acutalibacteraceae bacterium]
MMKLKDDKMSQAEYDRFIDLMARMYLKYGGKYRVVTKEDVLKQFPKRQSKEQSRGRKCYRKEE